MQANLKFEFDIIFGLFETNYTCPVYAASLFKAIEKLSDHYFRCHIIKTYVFQGGKKIEVPEISNIMVRGGLPDIQNIIKNFKAIQKRKYGILKK